MTNKEAISFLQSWRSEEYMSDLLVKTIDMAIKALEKSSKMIDVDEYGKRLVDKYSEGFEATEVDKGINIALELLDEMEEEMKEEIT